MNILVTGGAGYVGTTLVPVLLARGHTVRVLDALRFGGDGLLGIWANPRFEFHRGDIRDAATVLRALDHIDAVVHLAAIVGDPACAAAPEVAREVNLDASLNLVRAAQQSGVQRFLFASTCSNYGRMPDPDALVTESSPLAPVSLYAETKVAVERALLELAGDGGMAVTPLRFATVFGVSPRMRFDLTVNEFTLSMVRDGRLTVYGEQFWRPYIHVRDLAVALLTVLEAEATVVHREVFNVGATAENYQKQQIVQLVAVHAPDAVVEYVRRNEDPRDYRVDFAKIRARLDFTPSHSVASGVAEVARLVRAGIIPGPAPQPEPA